MQSSQKLTCVLRDLILLIEEEAASNPVFSQRLEAITANLPVVPSRKHARQKSASAKKPKESIPDVYATREAKGEAEFPLWLRSLDLVMLKAIVKVNGFDPGNISRRWTEPDKFVNLIVEQVAARLRRGSGFLPPKFSKQDANLAVDERSTKE